MTKLALYDIILQNRMVYVYEGEKMDLQGILKLIDERKSELFELLSSLIKINSETFGAEGGNEGEIAKYLYSVCEKAGIEAELYTPLDVEGFDSHKERMNGYNLNGRYNLTARFRGRENVDTLMLMGHSDTVQVGDRANWDFDPFCGEIKDGKILGRGANDDKFALAASLFLFKLFKQIDFVPRSNMLFSAYCDEEYGGSHGALAAVLKYPCENILNIDGMADEIWHCATGGQDVEYTFRTENAAESAETGARAILTALEVLEEFKNNRKRELGENRFYRGTAVAELPMYYLEVRVGDNGSDLGVGKIAFEYFTDKTEPEIYAELDSLNEKLSERLRPMGILSCGFRPLCRFFHYVFCEPDSRIVNELLAAYEAAGAKRPNVCGSCLSDYSVISKYGSKSSLTFGIAKNFAEPGGPHQNNEFVDCEKLVELTKIIAAYIFNTMG